MGNREETERKILDGVDRLIRAEGFTALGINALAREAGVSKVLLYRYFGSLENLVRTWALEKHYWSGADLLPSGKGDRSRWEGRAASLFEGQLDRLWDNPLLREVIRWHISSEDPLSREIMDRVERDGHEIMESFTDSLETDLDTEALIALIIGGIYYLAVISDRTDVFNGIPLGGEEGRIRLKRGISQLTDLVFSGIRERGGGR